MPQQSDVQSLRMVLGSLLLLEFLSGTMRGLNSSLSYLVLLHGFNERHRNNTLPLHPTWQDEAQEAFGICSCSLRVTSWLWAITTSLQDCLRPPGEPELRCHLPLPKFVGSAELFIIELLHLVVEGEMRSTVSVLRCLGFYLWLITGRNSVSCSSGAYPITASTSKALGSLHSPPLLRCPHRG